MSKLLYYHTVDFFVGANFHTNQILEIFVCTLMHLHIVGIAIFKFWYNSYARLTYEKYKNWHHVSTKSTCYTEDTCMTPPFHMQIHLACTRTLIAHYTHTQCLYSTFTVLQCVFY